MGRRVGAAHPDGTIARYYYFLEDKEIRPLSQPLRHSGTKYARPGGSSGGRTGEGVAERRDGRTRGRSKKAERSGGQAEGGRTGDGSRRKGRSGEDVAKGAAEEVADKTQQRRGPADYGPGGA